MVEHTAHNGVVIGSNPIRLKKKNVLKSKNIKVLT